MAADEDDATTDETKQHEQQKAEQPSQGDEAVPTKSDQFDSLRIATQSELEKVGVSVKSLLDKLYTIPAAKKEPNQKFLIKYSQEFVACKDIRSVFLLLNTHWDYQNLDILAGLITTFSLQSLYTQLDACYANVHHFNDENISEGVVDEQQTVAESSPLCETIVAIVVLIAIAYHHAADIWEKIWCFPSPVRNLSAEVDETTASVTLRWNHPIKNRHKVKGYYIRYKRRVDDDTLFITKSVTHQCEECQLTQLDGIKPLNNYLFEVQPKCGWVAWYSKWKHSVIFINWYCRFPDCASDRRKRDNTSVSDFCSSDHAIQFSRDYCLFPGCCTRRLDVSHHFCTKEHLVEATTRGFSGLVSLDQSPKEYRKLKDQFSDKWCKGRGQQPQIIAIYKIVNPSLERRFKEYSTLITSSSSLWYKSEEYYHGTPLTCNLPEYSQPCSDTKCGVCGITKRGFDPERISKNGLLTFGKGFYFVPMSSKAYDYPVNDHTPRLRFRALLVCDVMAGCKYHKYERDQNFHLPEPYHSVYGNTRKYFIFSTEFDSAELAVYKAEAIMPRYVLICENLRPA